MHARWQRARLVWPGPLVAALERGWTISRRAHGTVALRLDAGSRLLRIVADSGRSVDALLADVPKFVSTPEIRVDCPDDRKFALVNDAVQHFRSKYDVIDVDGVRVLFGDGWGLIRASNTQPVLVTRYEARTSERLAAIQGEMEAWLRTQGVHP